MVDINDLIANGIRPAQMGPTSAQLAATTSAQLAAMATDMTRTPEQRAAAYAAWQKLGGGFNLGGAMAGGSTVAQF